MGYYIAIILAVLVPLFHTLGAISAINAVMTARTPQGSVAWAISLITFPYIAVPLYWVFGRGRFHGFIETMRIINTQRRREIEAILHTLHEQRAELPTDRHADVSMLARLAPTSWTRGNSIRLLIDGDATFAAIFDAIRNARRYVLIQFFIIHDDRLGRDLKHLLLTKAREGIKIHLLYDEVGCHTLPRSYINDLRAGGIDVSPFNTRQGWRNRFQINFRNHRKIVIVDGEVAFAGGHNVGDEYLGHNPRFGHWRDTHVEVRGPSVLAQQLSFAMDWYWATRQVPEMSWTVPAQYTSDQSLLVLPTGPADVDDNCLMMFLGAIASAKKRFWIASPYFVPDAAVFEAMKLAARRGVDVRVLLPERPDHLFVYLASFDFVPEAVRSGIKIHRYTNGFLHEKVFLVDDDLASVGSANLDTRSIRLNFEVTILALNKQFAAEVEQMLTNDFADSRLSDLDDVQRRGYLFRVAIRIARLLSPVL